MDTATGRFRSARAHLWAAAATLLTLAGGCRQLHSNESALSPAGPQAQRIAHLTWIFIGVCVVVYVLVIAFLIGPFLRKRDQRGSTTSASAEPDLSPDMQRERRLWTVVSACITLSVITLFVLLFCDFITGRAVHNFAQPQGAIRIRILAHQWWWEARYDDWPAQYGDRVSSNIVTTADEIHIPFDPTNPIPIEFDLNSADVIHSFWVPSLHGKKDVVPGHPNVIWLAADHAGTYWGECGEYCGYQHAQMRLAIVAEPPEKFHAWLDAMRKPAPEPATDMQKRGRQVFMSGTCLMCHAIEGTDAWGRVGPDLTHVASRKTLAAGAIPNTEGHLAGWIVDPQKIKPGVRMPQNNLDPRDLRALLEYLESLK